MNNIDEFLLLSGMAAFLNSYFCLLKPALVQFYLSRMNPSLKEHFESKSYLINLRVVGVLSFFLGLYAIYKLWERFSS
ncbi:hypothetical protein CH371_15560 [Leptospira wolffii]|uniref:Uncharacterized protein n=1 Tax=Leptospira wolffii TaxID=409998 RepID=A0A2M9Z921_9LEPT|nr:hypothetical protein CH371_15560 [Leptospira wolffii]